MVEIGFYLLSLVMIISPMLIINNSEPASKYKKKYTLVIIGWVIYVTTLSNLGWLNDYGFPPRVPLLIVIPAIIYMLAISNKKWFKVALTQVHNHRIIYVQSFRIIVELLIYGAYLDGVFPKRATFDGLNYDILVGISALPMGYLVQKQYIKSKGILIWNFVSLLILSITVYSFVSSYYFLDFGQGQNFGFVRQPYIFMASILLPFAIFFHIASIRKQLMKHPETNQDE